MIDQTRVHHTVQFYRRSNVRALAQGPVPEWPSAFRLLAHCSVLARTHADAAFEFVRIAAADRWWVQPGMTLRCEPARASRVDPGDVLAIAERDADHVTLYRVAAIGARKVHLERVETEGRPAPISGTVDVIHAKELLLCDRRARATEARAHRRSTENNTMQHGLNLLLEGCGHLAQGFATHHGVQFGALPPQDPRQRRFLALLRIVSELVATLPCEQMDPGGMQLELDVIAEMAQVQHAMVPVPILDTPPPALPETPPPPDHFGAPSF